jgi:hypothetical protein
MRALGGHGRDKCIDLGVGAELACASATERNSGTMGGRATNRLERPCYAVAGTCN